MTECDLLIAASARFDDRVTRGKIRYVSHPQQRLAHIDIDPAEVNKNRRVDVAIVSDVIKAVGKINENFVNNNPSLRELNIGGEKINLWKNKHPLFIPPKEGKIYPQEVLLKVREFSPEAFTSGCWTTSNVGCSVSEKCSKKMD